VCLKWCCESGGLGRIGWGEPAYGLSLVSGGNASGARGAGGAADCGACDAGRRGRGGAVVIYARVSSDDQRADLDRQVARLTAWVTQQDLTVGQVVVEFGSGLNGNRPKWRRILSDPDAKVIVVEHRDRFGPLRDRTSRGGAFGVGPPHRGGRWG
jgi:resolvase-like protein